MLCLSSTMSGIEIQGFVCCEVEEGEGGMRGRHSLDNWKLGAARGGGSIKKLTYSLRGKSFGKASSLALGWANPWENLRPPLESQCFLLLYISIFQYVDVSIQGFQDP